MNSRKYQICTNCIMDTSDSTITFDERGWCDYCRNFHQNILPNWHPNERGVQEITPLIEKIKREGKGRDHDCLIGISGGLDSSYVTYVAKEKFGLRPLMFHCDAGWNSDLGVSNIQKIIEGLGLDLVTEVVNWEEMKDLQRAFFKSQVPFVDTPQDLALFSAIYNFAAKNDFKYVITGGNNSTECVRESIEWTYFSTDMRHVRDVHKRFGSRPLDTFPVCDILKYKTLLPMGEEDPRHQASRLRAVHQKGSDTHLDGTVWLAALSAEALRVALHAVLRVVLDAEEIRLRQAACLHVERDPHGAADARRGAAAHREAGARRANHGPGVRVRRDQARLDSGRVRRDLPRREQDIQRLQEQHVLDRLGARLYNLLGLDNRIFR